VIDGVRAIRRDLPLALRVSAFDTVTHVPDADGFGGQLQTDRIGIGSAPTTPVTKSISPNPSN
jgi:hypothetical protein